MRSTPRALALLALVSSLFVVAAPAAASEGSVPPEVTAYTTGGALVERLEQIYGENQHGEGIPFDETTTPGPISRVYHWTDARLAGDTTGKATRMVNEWAVPITLVGEPVGVALLWVNVETDRAELAEFQPGADAAVALAAVPENARLVRDVVSAAWFAVADNTVTPLVTGASGVVAPIPLDQVALASPAPAPPVTDTGGTGIWVAVLAIAFLAAVAVVGVWLPARGRREASPSAAVPDEADTPEV